jgi:hypothetical protein
MQNLLERKKHEVYWTDNRSFAVERRKKDLGFALKMYEAAVRTAVYLYQQTTIVTAHEAEGAVRHMINDYINQD